jgi:general secretion pathway protein C
MSDTWPARLLTLAAWALAAWSATYWALQFPGTKGSEPPLAAAPAPAMDAEPTQVGRLFGPAIEVQAPEPAPAPLPVPVVVAVVEDPATRFALVGVVADQARSGVALLSVEGRPARPYRVGSTIEDAYQLKSVSASSATLTETASGTTFTVDLPAAAARGASAGTAVAPGIPLPWPGPMPAASMGRRSS